MGQNYEETNKSTTLIFHQSLTAAACAHSGIIILRRSLKVSSLTPLQSSWLMPTLDLHWDVFFLPEWFAFSLSILAHKMLNSLVVTNQDLAENSENNKASITLSPHPALTTFIPNTVSACPDQPLWIRNSLVFTLLTLTSSGWCLSAAKSLLAQTVSFQTPDN